MARSVLFFLLLLGLSACSRQVVFYSEPSGARVAVNENYLGTTPCRSQFRTWFASDRTVEISKEGYMPQLVTLAADKNYLHVTLTPSLARQ